MSLLRFYLEREIDELERKGVRVRVIGGRDGLSPDILELIERAEARTAHNAALDLQIALNYGGRARDRRAPRARSPRRSPAGRSTPRRSTRTRFGRGSDTAGLPDPDLLVRTSGEQRHQQLPALGAGLRRVRLPARALARLRRGAPASEALAEFLRRERRYGARLADASTRRSAQRVALGARARPPSRLATVAASAAGCSLLLVVAPRCSHGLRVGAAGRRAATARSGRLAARDRVLAVGRGRHAAMASVAAGGGSPGLLGGMLRRRGRGRALAWRGRRRGPAFGVVYIGLPALAWSGCAASRSVGLDAAAVAAARGLGDRHRRLSSSAARSTGRALAPAISPNKTWSGFVGGMVGAGARRRRSSPLAARRWPSAAAALAAARCSRSSRQAGDLFESRAQARASASRTAAPDPGPRRPARPASTACCSPRRRWRCSVCSAAGGLA